MKLRLPGSRRARTLTVALIGCFALVFTQAEGCGSSDSGSKSQASQQAVTDAYMTAAINAVPYPLGAMQTGGWLERTLLKENLLRQNNAHRRAFVTLMSANGTPIMQFAIQGMVFDLNSQMTNTDFINRYCTDCSGGGVAVTTQAAGDNGTWGDEPHAISFFTTSGVQVKWNGIYIETDAPVTIPNKPLVIFDENAAPSSTGGIVSNGKIDTGGTVAKSK